MIKSWGSSRYRKDGVHLEHLIILLVVVKKLEYVLGISSVYDFWNSCGVRLPINPSR